MGEGAAEESGRDGTGGWLIGELLAPQGGGRQWLCPPEAKWHSLELPIGCVTTWRPPVNTL